MVNVDLDRLVFNPLETGCILSLPGPPGGGSKLHDRSSYGNIGSVTGATWTKTSGGLWCLRFDGADDHVDCGAGASLDVTQNMTLLGWIKMPSTQIDEAGTVGAIAAKYSGGGWVFYYRTNGSLTEKGLAFYAGSGGEVAQTAWNPQAETWYQAGVVLKGAGAVEVFVNGVSVKVGSISGVAAKPAQPLLIGKYGTSYFEGSIALLRLYNRPLSALEIGNGFNQEKNLFGVC